MRISDWSSDVCSSDLVLAAHFLKKSDGPSYATQPVSRGALTTSVSATGKLAPVNQVTVGSQLSGLVTQVMVDVNDRVAKGQALALIDPEQIDDQIRAGRAQLAASTASVTTARATLEQANATLARSQEVSRLNRTADGEGRRAQGSVDLGGGSS